MRLSISKMASLSGVSVRTLHYYDQIGLLSPDEVDPQTGYRWYGETELQKLQQILFYRELDFPLRQIRKLMTMPDYDAGEALARQKELLELKRRRLNRLLSLLNDNLRGERTMDFSGFDTRELDSARDAYAAEAKARWGKTDAWEESERRAVSRTPGQQEAMNEQTNALFRRFAALREEDPASEEAHETVDAWRNFLTEHYYSCTEEVLAGLGELYCQDKRFEKNLDRFGAGTAAFMSAAIAAYCKK